MGPNFKMITIIICKLGAIELQRTLVWVGLQHEDKLALQSMSIFEF